MKMVQRALHIHCITYIYIESVSISTRNFHIRDWVWVYKIKTNEPLNERPQFIEVYDVHLEERKKTATLAFVEHFITEYMSSETMNIL